MQHMSACEVGVSELELDRRRLHAPKPKGGGAAHAFDLTQTGPLTDLLGQRLRESHRLQRKGQWLLPTDSKPGHVAEVVKLEFDGLTGHALRHTYVMADQLAEEPEEARS